MTNPDARELAKRLREQAARPVSGEYNPNLLRAAATALESLAGENQRLHNALIFQIEATYHCKQIGDEDRVALETELAAVPAQLEAAWHFGMEAELEARDIWTNMQDRDTPDALQKYYAKRDEIMRRDLAEILGTEGEK